MHAFNGFSEDGSEYIFVCVLSLSLLLSLFLSLERAFARATTESEESQASENFPRYILFRV